MDIASKARVLSDALPNIRRYNGKVVVIKYGGNAMLGDELKHAVMSDIVMLSLIGVKVVLVHGGGPEISEMLKRVGKKSEFVGGLRYTDGETAEVVRMVLAGKTNKTLTDLICRNGGKAVGICGQDGHLLKCSKQDEELGFVGRIEQVNTQIIVDLLGLGYVPVVATVGYDDEGNIYNINADTAAASIAGALNAESLILMTDIRGLLEDKDDPDSLIKKVYVSDIPALVKQGIISGGMIPKIECCKDAIRRGVKKAVIIDGRVSHSILIELLSDEGSGTMFV